MKVLGMRVGINGFGRIGRGIFRRWLDQCDKAAWTDTKIVHINTLASIEMSAHLMSYDSVHGRVRRPLKVTSDQNLAIGGHFVTMSHHADPQHIPWDQYDVDVVFECTGAFTSREKATLHLRHKDMAVMISAPSPDPDKTIVVGVNHHLITGKEQILSNASCTTNCLAPVCMVLNDQYKINQATITTVHAVTSDQKLLDGPHRDFRRARAAWQSMIPTTTGAAQMVGEVIPDLKGKIDGLAIRVPTANVSLTDLVVSFDQLVTARHINQSLCEASLNHLKNIVDVSSQPLVSTDYLGTQASSVVDLELTKVIDGHMAKLLLWYDNETGFSARMWDLAQRWYDKHVSEISTNI